MSTYQSLPTSGQDIHGPLNTWQNQGKQRRNGGSSRRIIKVVAALIGLLALVRLLYARPDIFRSREDTTHLSAIDILTARPMDPSLQFTINEDQYSSTAPISHYGSSFSNLKIADGALLYSPGTESLWGEPYNLAMLRLPKGLEWEFLAVARGPKNTLRSEKTIGGNHETFVHSLIGFGLNLTSNNTFELASVATTLNIPTHHSMGCDVAFRYIKGPEDPRIYWSDYKVPMLSFGMPSSTGSCRGISLVHDLRSIWPDLTRVLYNAPDVLPYRAGAFGNEFIELTRERNMNTEKNWMMFYPGATPQANPGLPFAHFNSWPDENCRPPKKAIEGRKKGIPAYNYEYAEKSQNSAAQSCVKRNFPFLHARVHGATPLVRFTLCPRGTCIPDIHNTVFVAINHLKLPWGPKHQIQYSRYFEFWNVSSPFDPVAVGPQFQLNGPDNESIVYALSLNFVPDTRQENARSGYLSALSYIKGHEVSDDALFGTSHGFLGDRVFVGLGLKDNEMATIELSMDEEMLVGLRRCAD